MNSKAMYSLLLSLPIAVILTGCNSEEDSLWNQEVNTSKTDLLNNYDGRKVVDASVIKGLSYYCSDNKTSIKSTGKNGSFSCNQLPVSFSIGELFLGNIEEITLGNTLYTTDILGIARGATRNPEVTKLSVLLQSLDEDGDINNGINVSQESISFLNSYISYNTKLQDLTIDDVIYMVEDIIKQRTQKDQSTLLQVVSVPDAQDNLTEMLASSPPVIR